MKEKEMLQIEILTPLIGEFYPNESEWEWEEGAEPEEGFPLDGHDLVQYEASIQEAVDRYNDITCDSDQPCNMMEYYHEEDAIKEKVKSAVISVRSENGQLWGCVTLQMTEPFEGMELQKFCRYMSGQYSDGWGEGFEQREIAVDGGAICVHFGYQVDRMWERAEVGAAVQQQEMDQRPQMKLVGHDGNIFAIMGRARKLLCKNGQRAQAEEMMDRVTSSDSYHKALNIISEYVKTELSEELKTSSNPDKKPTRGECR